MPRSRAHAGRDLRGRAIPRLGLNAARDETAVLETLRGEGAAFERVVFTDNRRVMASLGDGGRTLRLHRCFAAAPDEVLGAVAALFSSRDRRARTAARAAVRRFAAVHLPAPSAAPPARRPHRVPAADRLHLLRLAAEFERVNTESFGDALPAVPLHLSGRMTRRNGHFRAVPPEIAISRRLCTHGVPGEAERTLRHEMIHLWQHATGARLGHGAEFRRWAGALDIVPRATREVCWGSR